nr:Ig-like domain-containing protein [Lachnospiraceae bacterium]
MKSNIGLKTRVAVILVISMLMEQTCLVNASEDILLSGDTVANEDILTGDIIDDTDPADSFDEDRHNTDSHDLAPEKAAPDRAASLSESMLGQVGDNAYASYDVSLNTLYITGSGLMWDASGNAGTYVTKGNGGAGDAPSNTKMPYSDTLMHAESPVHIYISEGITGIGANAFGDSKNGTFPKKIADVMFEDPSKIEYIGWYGLSNLKIANRILNLESLKKIGQYGLMHTSGFEEITIGEGLETIHKGAFAFMHDCKKVNYNAIKAERVDGSSNSQYYYNSQPKVYAGEFAGGAGDDGYLVYNTVPSGGFSPNTTESTEITFAGIGDGEDGVIINISNNVEKLTDYLFYDSMVDEINIDKDSQIKYIGDHCFADTDIKTITVPKNTEIIGNSIVDCTPYLESINYYAGNAEQHYEYIYQHGSSTMDPKNDFISKAFKKTSSTYDIYIHNVKTRVGDGRNFSIFADSASTDSSARKNHRDTGTKYTLYIKDSVETMPFCMCREEDGLERIDFTDATSLVSIPDGFVYRSGVDNSLKEIVGLENTKIEYIGELAFAENTNVTSHIKLPSTVKRIADGAFYDMSSVTEFTIPDGITYYASDSDTGSYTLAGGKEDPVRQPISDQTDFGDYYYIVGSKVDTVVHVSNSINQKENDTDIWKKANRIITNVADTIILSGNTLSMNVGEKHQLVTEVLPRDAINKTVTWKSDNESVATVSDNGLVTALSKGTAAITATTHNGLSAVCSVTVTEKPVPVQGLLIDPMEKRLEIGESFTINPTIIPENATNKKIIWKSTNNNIATVSDNGVVTAGETPGVVTITATTEDGGFGMSCSVDVESIRVKSVKINEGDVFMTVGEDTTLTATCKPDNAATKTVEWSSSDPSIVTIAMLAGFMEAKAVGTVTVTARAVDGSGVSDNCTVTVVEKKVAVTDITLNRQAQTIFVGESVKLNAAVYPDNATDQRITWKSDDEKIATVSDNGLVIGKGLGTTSIRAKTSNGVEAKCSITVKKLPVKVTGVEMSPVSKMMRVNESFYLSVKVLPNNADDRTYTFKLGSGSNGIISLSSNGLVKALKEGVATVTVVTNDGGYEATSTISVNRQTDPTPKPTPTPTPTPTPKPDVDYKDTNIENKEEIDFDVEGNDEELTLVVKDDAAALLRAKMSVDGRFNEFDKVKCFDIHLEDEHTNEVKHFGKCTIRIPLDPSMDPTKGLAVLTTDARDEIETLPARAIKKKVANDYVYFAEFTTTHFTYFAILCGGRIHDTLNNGGGTTSNTGGSSNNNSSRSGSSDTVTSSTKSTT